jgi:hypothetical protein
MASEIETQLFKKFGCSTHSFASFHVTKPDAPLKTSTKITDSEIIEQYIKNGGSVIYCRQCQAALLPGDTCDYCFPDIIPKELQIEDDSEPEMQPRVYTYNWRKENGFPQPPLYPENPDMDTDNESAEVDHENEVWEDKLLQDVGTEYTSQPPSPLKRDFEEDERDTPNKKPKMYFT